MSGLFSCGQIPRDIEESPSYELAATAIDPERRHLDDDLIDLLWEITRIPEAFFLYEARPGRPVCVAAKVDNPRYFVWFTYTDELVTLLGVSEEP
jgi:hypothetical protein